MDVSIRDIRKEFDRQAALDDVSLDIRSGELVALLGPSGSGKTTLLRLIAGLERPTAGSIHFGDEDASHRTVRERNVGFVFQHYALFRHMTVIENIGFGLKVRPGATRPPRTEIRRRVLELLDLVQLSGLGDRYPSQLSGGQRQRVALARAMAIEPKLLLLDEPFGALDAQVRRDLRRWLRELHDKTGYTTIFVTHDQEEAVELADRVVVMSQGRIEQVGTADEIYENPASPFVYSFIGEANRLPVDIRGGRILYGGAVLGRTAEADGARQMLVRPYEFEPAGEGEALTGTTELVRRSGRAWHAEIRLDGGAERLDVELAPGAEAAAGARVSLRPKRWTLYPVT